MQLELKRLGLPLPWALSLHAAQGQWAGSSPGPRAVQVVRLGCFTEGGMGSK